jgi:hypothetical protein
LIDRWLAVSKRSSIIDLPSGIRSLVGIFVRR